MFTTRFENIDDLLIDKALREFDTIEAFRTEDSFMEISLRGILVPSLEIELHTGTFWQKYENQEFMPDWNFTSINRAGRPITETIYYEQGSEYSCLKNFLNMNNINNVDIDELEITITRMNPPKLITKHKKFIKEDTM